MTVSVPPAFTARWLIPRLGDFYNRYPDVEVHLLATKRVVDFSMEEVDIAIRFGSDFHPGLSVEPLLKHETIVPVAAPIVAKTIKTPGDLVRANLIEDDWHIMRGNFPEWKSLLATWGVIDSSLNVRRFGDAELALQAATNGLGVTLAWHSLVVDDIKSGRLVRILNHSIASDLSYQLVMPKNKKMLKKVAAVRTWLLAQTTEHALGNV